MSTYSPVYTPPYYDSVNNSSKFNPTMAIIIIVLIAAFFLIGFMSIFLKRCLVGDVVTQTGPRRTYNSKVHGLAKDTINALPIVHFKDLNEKEDRECPVCLSDFEPEDSLRQLPQCKHVFHLECIDLWFNSHSTCPLCRASLSPSSRQPDNIDYTSDSGNEDVQPVAADGTVSVVMDTIQPENNGSMNTEGKFFKLNYPRVQQSPLSLFLIDMITGGISRDDVCTGVCVVRMKWHLLAWQRLELSKTYKLPANYFVYEALEISGLGNTTILVPVMAAALKSREEEHRMLRREFTTSM